MLKNYFKIALAVLLRRKFFTFISLFGISFTLTILMVGTAFIDKVVNDTYPDRKRDRSLYINNIEEDGKDAMNSSAMSFSFIQHYLGSLKMPANLAFSTNSKATNSYVNNRKIVINYKLANAAYWEVLDYKFLAGKPFTKQQVDAGERVAIISEDLQHEYFGATANVIGRTIEADNVKYRVQGVVRNVPVTAYQFYSDIYLPYSVSRADLTNKAYRGEYTAILLASSSSAVAAMEREFDGMVPKIPMEDKEHNIIHLHADPYLQSYVRTGNEKSSGMTYAITALCLLILFVMLLPTLNLVNINITRIMERSSEIGVRKAFGASSGTLVYQFIIENVIITLLGGIIAIVLSLIVLRLINAARFIANLDLSLNITVLAYGLGLCIFFGLVSGVYPAWRMSKLEIVTALKS